MLIYTSRKPTVDSTEPSALRSPLPASIIGAPRSAIIEQEERSSNRSPTTAENGSTTTCKGNDSAPKLARRRRENLTEEDTPQLRKRVYQTSQQDLTLAENLEKSKWEGECCEDEQVGEEWGVIHALLSFKKFILRELWHYWGLNYSRRRRSSFEFCSTLEFFDLQCQLFMLSKRFGSIVEEDTSVCTRLPHASASAQIGKRFLYKILFVKWVWVGYLKAVFEFRASWLHSFLDHHELNDALAKIYQPQACTTELLGEFLQYERRFPGEDLLDLSCYCL